MTTLPPAAEALLRGGTLCHLSARTPQGLHVTPVVFVLDGRRVWATTARGTVKARAWKRDPRVAGLVRVGNRALSFRGTVTPYDALDPLTWPASIVRGPALALASARFTMKNARFFAGYARDAHRVPLAWTPPGRVIVSVDLEAGAVLDTSSGEVEEWWGRWGRRAASRRAFRRGRGDPALRQLVPVALRRSLGPAGPGALGLEGSAGPAVLPARWAALEDAHYAVLSRPALSLAGVAEEAPAALVLDRPSAWRAAHMRGVLLRGPADVFLPGAVRTGRASLLAAAGEAGDLPADPAVVRLRAGSAVWWEGWASGTVRRR